jgi:creatinine amidohydrolase/Fe(II)-dependent formamide hydrolase-like protein
MSRGGGATFHERTRNGAFGDATQATQEAGEEIVEATVERAVAFAEDFILLQERQGQAVDAPRHDYLPGKRGG